MTSAVVSPVVDAVTLRRVITKFHDGLTSHRQVLDNLNVYPVPDGDTGLNMSSTLQSVLESCEDTADDLEALCAAISHGALMGARGNSGVILAQILRGICGALSQSTQSTQSTEPDAATMAAALQAASDGAYSAVARPVEGTILTVVREAAEAAQSTASQGASLVEVLDAASDRGHDALARTPEMLPVLAAAGVVDAGGAGLLLLFDACLNVFDGRPMPEPPEAPPSQAAAHAGTSDASGRAVSDAPSDAEHPASEFSVADLRYEVMFLLDAPDSAVDSFKAAWKDIGDSIVVVGGDGIWNCHIHTDHIGAAIEAGIAVGRPHRIEVTDILEQAGDHTEWFNQPPTDTDTANDDRVTVQAFEPVEITEVDSCAVVAVGAGAGLVEILESMGAQRVVTGGQSMNPSTAELLAAVDSLPTGNVVVLPNNKNIIGVAEQLDGETRRNVGVVPTRSVVEGLAALMSFNGTATITANLQEMARAADCVISGEVTQAVREASSSAASISTGDWLGIGPAGIEAVTSDMTTAATALLDSIVTDHHELLTVIAGEDADDAATAAIVSHMTEHHSDIEVEVTDGGQPLYPYYFGVE